MKLNSTDIYRNVTEKQQAGAVSVRRLLSEKTAAAGSQEETVVNLDSHQPSRAQEAVSGGPLNETSMFSQLMKLRLELLAMKEFDESQKKIASGSQEGEMATPEDSKEVISSGIEGEEPSDDGLDGMIACLDELLGFSRISGMGDDPKDTKVFGSSI